MLNLNIDYPDWHAKAACYTTPGVDPAWFHVSKRGAKGLKAKAICNGNPANKTAPCPVKDICLQWILDFDNREGVTSPGIYGGLGYKKRMDMRTCRNPPCTKKPPGKKKYCSQECLDIYTNNRHLREERYG